MESFRETILIKPSCRRLSLRNSSTSARLGAAEAPPKRVHLSAAAAEAKRRRRAASRLSASASGEAPWKASPAPSVSIVFTVKRRHVLHAAALAARNTPCGPSVTATKPASCLPSVCSAGRVIFAARWCRAGLPPRRSHACRARAADRSPWSAGRDRSRSECRAGAPRAQTAMTNSGKRLSTSTASASATSCAASAGSTPPSSPPRRVAMVFSPQRVEQDQRHRGGAAGNAHHAAAVDALGGKIGDDAVADRVVGAAERAGKLPRAPSRAAVTAALAAQPPPVTMKSDAATLVPGAGNFFTRMTMSCTEMPAQRIVGAFVRSRVQPKPISSSIQARMM